MLELLIDMELLSQALIVKKLHLVIKSRLKKLLIQRESPLKKFLPCAMLCIDWQLIGGIHNAEAQNRAAADGMEEHFRS